MKQRFTILIALLLLSLAALVHAGRRDSGSEYWPATKPGQTAVLCYYIQVVSANSKTRTAVIQEYGAKTAGSHKVKTAKGIKVVFSPATKAYLVLKGKPKSIKFKFRDLSKNKQAGYEGFTAVGKLKGTGALQAVAIYYW